MVKIAINGFGRIGKQFFLAAMEEGVNWDFVINELGNLDDVVYALKYDSVHPTPKESISHDGRNLIFGKKKIKIISEVNPEKLPWKAEKVDLVVECTGMFTARGDAMKHIKAGAKKVLISAPAKNPDCTIVFDVNNEALKKEHKIISAGSCTTNCIAPMVKILNDNFNIETCFFTTAHAYTATQKLIDAHDKKDPRRGRAAAQNIVPSTSGASQSVVEALPELKGKLEGYAIRIPVIDGSFSSVIAVVKRPISTTEVNSIFKQASSKDYKNILSYTSDAIVSSDIIHHPASCVFDGQITQVQKNTVSIAGWYDNECGYSCRLVDVSKLILKK